MTNQEKLLSAFKEKRIEDFRKLIEQQDIDVDYFYGEPDNGTLLDLACFARRPEETKEYVYLLIENGANVWRKDEETGKLTLHIIFQDEVLADTFWHAVYYSYRGNENASANVMKVAVEENDLEAIQLLARSYSEKLRELYFKKRAMCTDWFKDHPLDKHLILLQGSIDAVRRFINYFDVDMEFQTDSQGRVFSCREIILQKYPELEAEIQIPPPSCLPMILFSSLENGARELFVRQIAEVDTEVLNNNPFADAGSSYLHLACERNYIDVVDALLKKNVRLNERILYRRGFGENVTPIMVAAFNGCYEVFEKLFSIPKVELQNAAGSGSVLHLVLHGMQIWLYDNLSTDGHRKILELILKVIDLYYTINDELIIERSRLDIEITDRSDRTALHYALKFNNEFATKLLLRAGAKLYPKDQSILTSISAMIIESYFDDCINSKTDTIRARDSTDKPIFFRYRIFTQLDLYSIATKSKGNFFARFESVTEMRKLYQHPLTKSFLYLKWCLFKKYYYINFTFYLSFCLTLNTYIFLTQDCLSMLPSSANFNESRSTDSETNRDASSIQCDVALWMWLITLSLYMILILREVCQFFVSIRRYIGIPENWLEVTTIVVIGLLCVNDTSTHLAASAILTSWIGLILLLGKQPSLSIYIEMFKTVALNFAKFLLLYSILVASFAYSFFILFRNKTSGDASSQNQTNVNSTDPSNENSINPWQNLQMSFFKSIIMMTGELEASTLPLDSNLSFGHVFFILFVFLVTMVLYSLLNGLAVSDTRAIMDDAEIVALMSRAKLITQIERLACSNPFRNVFKCRTTTKKLEVVYEFLRKKLFNDRVRIDGTVLVCVYPAESNRIDINGEDFVKMPSSIVKQAEEILEKRKQSKLAKKENKNSLTDATKNHSSEHQSVNDLVHEFSQQMSDLKVEVVAKNAARDVILLQNVDHKFGTRMNKLLKDQIGDLKLEIDAKNAARDEKLLQNVDQRFDKMMNTSLNEKISDLKLEIYAKNVARDEKLLQNVDKRFDKINKLLETVLQEVNLPKNKG